MKILVMSDSHSSLRFMRRAIAAVKPSAVVHLGDYAEDAKTLAEENPQLPFHIVGGNCDRHRGGMYREMLCYRVCGVKLLMVHGHNHHVKTSLFSLLQDARTQEVDGVLFGHTHVPYCQIEPNGLVVLNPGSCGSDSGSVGLLEVEDEKIISCRVLQQDDLEGFL